MWRLFASRVQRLWFFEIASDHVAGDIINAPNARCKSNANGAWFNFGAHFTHPKVRLSQLHGLALRDLQAKLLRTKGCGFFFDSTNPPAVLLMRTRVIRAFRLNTS